MGFHNGGVEQKDRRTDKGKIENYRVTEIMNKDIRNLQTAIINFNLFSNNKQRKNDTLHDDDYRTNV